MISDAPWLRTPLSLRIASVVEAMSARRKTSVSAVWGNSETRPCRLEPDNRFSRIAERRRQKWQLLQRGENEDRRDFASATISSELCDLKAAAKILSHGRVVWILEFKRAIFDRLRNLNRFQNASLGF
jgi:hypothetical protein